MNEVKLNLEGISEIDVMELEKVLGPSVVQVTGSPRGPTDRHGDFGASAVLIALGPAALSALAVWLAKKRVKNIEESDIHIERGGDGILTMDIKTIRRSSSSGPPDAETTKSLLAGLENVIGKLGDGLPKA